MTTMNEQAFERLISAARQALDRPGEAQEAAVASLVAAGIIELERFNDDTKLLLMDLAADLADRAVCDCPAHAEHLKN